MLISDKVTPIGKAQPLANAEIERLSVIMAVTFNSGTAAFEIAQHFIFLTNFSFSKISSKK